MRRNLTSSKEDDNTRVGQYPFIPDVNDNKNIQGKLMHREEAICADSMQLSGDIRASQVDRQSIFMNGIYPDVELTSKGSMYYNYYVHGPWFISVKLLFTLLLALPPPFP